METKNETTKNDAGLPNASADAVVTMADADATIYRYALVENGVVTNITLWDGNTDTWNPDEGVLAIRIADDSQVGTGWTYDGTDFIAPPVAPPAPPTPLEILVTNTLIRKSMLEAAALAIGPLQDAVDIGEATEEETAMLTKWKQFRVAVNRIDLTQANPSWPVAPQPGYGAAVTNPSE